MAIMEAQALCVRPGTSAGERPGGPAPPETGRFPGDHPGRKEIGKKLRPRQSAEADKGRFNLENDEVGTALLELGDWEGTAAQLLEALASVDSSFSGKWSAKRLGRRIAKLWPHLEGVLRATREAEGHSKQTVYRFGNPAGFAGFQNGFSGKVPISSS